MILELAANGSNGGANDWPLALIVCVITVCGTIIYGVMVTGRWPWDRGPE